MFSSAMMMKKKFFTDGGTTYSVVNRTIHPRFFHNVRLVANQSESLRKKNPDHCPTGIITMVLKIEG